MTRRKATTPLDAWLTDQGLIRSRFAERIGLSPKQLRNALDGRPSKKAAEAIIAGTGGALDYNALFQKPSPAKKPVSKQEKK